MGEANDPATAGPSAGCFRAKPQPAPPGRTLTVTYTAEPDGSGDLAVGKVWSTRQVTHALISELDDAIFAPGFDIPIIANELSSVLVDSNKIILEGKGSVRKSSA